jgi:hypothetical protein
MGTFATAPPDRATIGTRYAFMPNLLSVGKARVILPAISGLRAIFVPIFFLDVKRGSFDIGPLNLQHSP